MINRFLIISLMFLVNKISFASDSSINMSTQTQKNNRLELAKKMSSRANSLVYLNGNRNPDTCEAVRNKNQLDEVTGFFHSNFTKIVDQDNLISLWTNENTRKLVLKEWDLETNNAARENREPYYLPLISKLVEFKLVDFVKKREQGLSTKEDLTKHKYSLLFSMRAYNSTAYYAASNAYDELYFYDDYAYKAAIKTATNATYNATRAAANRDAVDAVDNAVDNAARNAVDNAARNAAEKTSMNASNLIMKKLKNRNPSSIEIEIIQRLTYRVTEKTALLYFLENFETIVSASYEASMNSLGEVPNDNIFESKVKWDEFKKKYFSEVENNPEVYHFLEHWIHALGKGEVR